MPIKTIDTEKEERNITPIERGDGARTEGERRAVPGRETERARELFPDSNEQADQRVSTHYEHEQVREQPSSAPASVVPARRIDPLTAEVEEIMSEDLGTEYAKLTPQQRIVFRREGEKAASKIRILLEHARVKAKSIIEIIRRWLRLIPGVNKFFLEQEAKIKADKILALHKKIHRM